jgi:hypothetical protein
MSQNLNHTAYFNVRQCLAIQNEAATFPHGIVDTEVFHSEHILVQVKRAEIPNASNEELSYNARLGETGLPNHGPKRFDGYPAIYDRSNCFWNRGRQSFVGHLVLGRRIEFVKSCSRIVV